MVGLKLARLPERTPVSIIFKAAPELDLKLRQYAGLYRAACGEDATIAELVPFFLEAFLNSDRAFVMACRDGVVNEVAVGSSRHKAQKAKLEAVTISTSMEDQVE